MSSVKAGVYQVNYFVQLGMACGGKDETITVTAFSEAEAIAKAKSQVMKNRAGSFKLVSVSKIGAQG